MNRRQYLTGTAAATTVAIAGCVGSISGGSSGPKYEDVTKEEMLLDESAFPDGWVRDDQLNDNYDAGFANSDETIIVLLGVQINDDIETAEENFEQSRAGFRDPQDLDIGDEAFWDTRNDQSASTILRDSNVLGESAASRESTGEVIPDQRRSQQYAREMFSHWRDI